MQIINAQGRPSIGKDEQVKILTEDNLVLLNMVRHHHILFAYILGQLPEGHEFAVAGRLVLDNLEILNGSAPPQEAIDACIKAVLDHSNGKHEEKH